MEDISRRVARLEKEFEFWTNMYPGNRNIIEGLASHQVQLLESDIELYQNRYRRELQEDLGKDFSIEQMCKGNYIPLRNHFFPMKYHQKISGIILPFTKAKKVFLDSRVKDDGHVLEVFHKRGYRIQTLVSVLTSINDAYCVVAGDEESFDLTFKHQDMI